MLPIRNRQAGTVRRACMTTGATFWICLLLCVFAHFASAVIQEPFETAEPTWQKGWNDCQMRLQFHGRTFEESHTKSGSEHLRFWAGRGGTAAYFTHPIPQARVIDELVASVWVKSPRSGLQLSVRVVLPRSVDPQTGQPLTRLLAGSAYEDAGRWQQLRVENLTQLLTQQTRLLRSRYGPAVDPAEAYIDLVVLNAYAGDGVTEIWLDDLELTGFAAPVQPARAAGVSRTASSYGTTNPPAGRIPIQADGSLLLVNNKPFFARVAEWRGESFRFLADLGFNTIRLAEQPTREQVLEAEQLELWLVTPPPPTTREVDADAHRTLCWQVGTKLAAHDLPATVSRIAAIRRQAMPNGIPILCGVESDIQAFAEQSDLLQLSRAPIGTSTELTDVAAWWRDHGAHLRPVKPFWASIQTELPAALQQQLRGFAEGHQLEPDVEPEQIWLQTILAIASGARGIEFQARTRLDGRDRSSVRRAAAIRVMNHYLLMLEPWCAGGEPGQPIPLRTPGIYAATLETDLSRLVLVCRLERHQQYVVGGSSRRPPPLISLPSRHVADQAWQIAGGHLKRLPASAGVGGTLRIEEPDLFGLYALWSQPLVINRLGQASDIARRNIVADFTKVTRMQLEETDRILRRLAKQGYAMLDLENTLARIHSAIEESRQLQHGGDLQHAFEVLESAAAQLRVLRKTHWHQVSLAFPDPVSNPLCTSFRTLEIHLDSAQQNSQLQWGPNAMAGGGFENLEHLLASKWSQQTQPDPRIGSRVELTLETPRSGRHALKMQSWADGPFVKPSQWPVWMNSAPVPVRSGNRVLIRGVVRVDDQITGNGDGLLIFDTMTGIDMAVRIRKTRGWQEFELHRVAPSSGEMRVVFALTGLGTALIDDVSVRVGTPTEQHQPAPRAARLR